MSKVGEQESVLVVGQGYVGLPIAMAAVGANFKVTGIDLDARRIDFISQGKSPVEDITSTQLKMAIDNGRYSPVNSYEQLDTFDFAIVTVPTPLREGLPDLSFIESAAKSLSTRLRVGCTVILESTTYPGTTEEFLLPILEKDSGLIAGRDFFLGYSPERIDPGNGHWNLLNTPKIVSGVNEISVEKVASFYNRLGIEVVRVSGTREAEMTKLLENTFRHVNIALVNELAVFSRSLGVNIWEAIDAAATKPFGFMKFTPGPGVGGHCLPVDPSYLSWAIKDKSGESFKFVELANEVNDYMPKYVLRRLEEILERSEKTLAGSTILLLGLAYKPDTGDIRESPAIAVSELLRDAGVHVYAMDEFVDDYAWPPNILRHHPSDAVKYDAAVMLTNHRSSEYDSLLKEVPAILDTRNVLSGPNVERL